MSEESARRSLSIRPEKNNGFLVLPFVSTFSDKILVQLIACMIRRRADSYELDPLGNLCIQRRGSHERRSVPEKHKGNFVFLESQALELSFDIEAKLLPISDEEDLFGLDAEDFKIMDIFDCFEQQNEGSKDPFPINFNSKSDEIFFGD